MGKTKGGFLESLNNKNKKGAPFLMGALLTLTSGVALAADLSVSDKDGVTYLKVDAPQGSSLDLKVIAHSKSSSAETLTLKRVGDATGLNKSLSLSDKETTFDDVKVGTYTLTSSSPLLKVEEVIVVPEDIAKSEESTKDLEKAGYAVGGVALIGGIVAATSDNGVFGSSGSNGSGNSAREGDVGTGSSVSAPTTNSPRSGPTPTPDLDFDENRPMPSGTPRPLGTAVQAITTPTPTPFEYPAGNPSGQPSIMPAPSPADPMTPS